MDSNDEFDTDTSLVEEEIDNRDKRDPVTVKNSFIAGYHAYKIKPPVGKKLTVLEDPSYPYHENGWAFKVLLDGELIGHVPKELNAIFHSLMINKLGNITISCYATGKPGK